MSAVKQPMQTLLWDLWGNWWSFEFLMGVQVRKLNIQQIYNIKYSFYQLNFCLFVEKCY